MFRADIVGWWLVDLLGSPLSEDGQLAKLRRVLGDMCR